MGVNIVSHLKERTEKRVLRRIFGPKREEVTTAAENCIMKGVMIHTLHQILLG
jgi:hypothetical protein